MIFFKFQKLTSNDVAEHKNRLHLTFEISKKLENDSFHDMKVRQRRDLV